MCVYGRKSIKMTLMNQRSLYTLHKTFQNMEFIFNPQMCQIIISSLIFFLK